MKFLIGIYVGAMIGATGVYYNNYTELCTRTMSQGQYGICIVLSNNRE